MHNKRKGSFLKKERNFLKCVFGSGRFDLKFLESESFRQDVEFSKLPFNHLYQACLDPGFCDNLYVPGRNCWMRTTEKVLVNKEI